MTYPSGFAVKYLYTASGYLCRITDTGGSHTCVTTPDSHVIWTAGSRDAAMHLLQATAGNGAITTNTFETLTGLPSTIRAGAADGIAQFDYAYDLAGNLTYRSDDLNGVFERFCYDPLNRLTKAALGHTDPGASCPPGGTVTSVGYDALGNITSKDGVGTYHYPAAGTALPHAVSSITGTVNGVTNPPTPMTPTAT